MSFVLCIIIYVMLTEIQKYSLVFHIRYLMWTTREQKKRLGNSVILAQNRIKYRKIYKCNMSLFRAWQGFQKTTNANTYQSF